MRRRRLLEGSYSNFSVNDAALIRGRHLLDSGAYSDLIVNSAALIRGRHLFEARCLLEEIRYI